MSKPQILNILGQPSKVVDCRDDGYELVYNHFKIKLFFSYEDDEKLYSIEIYNKNIHFESEKVIGLTSNELLKFMKKTGYEDYEKEDYGYFETFYFDECNTTFALEFDEIISFEFSPLFEANNEKIIWPNI